MNNELLEAYYFMIIEADKKGEIECARLKNYTIWTIAWQKRI